MLSIIINGREQAASLSNWKIHTAGDDNTLFLTCSFPSGKSLTRPLDDCHITPIRKLSRMLLTRSGSAVSCRIEQATVYGGRYAVVYYPGSSRPYVFRTENITLSACKEPQETPVFQYFMAVAKARCDAAGPEDKKQLAARIVQQMEKLPAAADTALQAYCTGRIGTLSESRDLIFPFGVNESQLTAIDLALRAKISVIEGPPGTGKTQTILNILANIVLRGQTVAVLSNNNAAVDNIYEKLQKYGLEHLMARLGSQKNRENFFTSPPARPEPTAQPQAGPVPTPGDIQAMLQSSKQHLHDQNRAARLQAEIDELHIEHRHLQQWQKNNGVQSSIPLEKYRLSPRKTADLLAFLSHLGERRIGLLDRITLLLDFGIWRCRPFASAQTRPSVVQALQLHYYEQALRDRQDDLQNCHDSLHIKKALKELETASMRHLNQYLGSQPSSSAVFTENTYRKHFDAFIKRFPVIGSSTHSIVNSIASEAILDYVIIDEASQQDIIPGILALGCARNLIIVGDSRQLGHIPVALGMQAPDPAYDCEHLSLLDSCIAVFGEALPRTMLKEHYRCHPRIIQFCNQQFYNNALIPMTEDRGEACLRLIVTARGNHARHNTNQRELDSLLKVLEDEQAPIRQESNGRGFIAPYKDQVALGGERLPADFVRETVHKFQGRECDEIVFSTVLDKKTHNQECARLHFVDDPRMINVAVSRARHRFTLVTGEDIFTGNNSHIAALIRYMKYYSQESHLIYAPVVSAFDLLYEEFDQSLSRLQARLRADDSPYRSEQIAAELLRQALAAPACQSLMWHREVTLDKIVSPDNPRLTAHERAFMGRSRCDFVIYHKVGKTPAGVIEIDGDTHNQHRQAERDSLKDRILTGNGIPLLRLRTIDSGIEEKLAAFLARCAGSACGTQATRTAGAAAHACAAH